MRRSSITMLLIAAIIIGLLAVGYFTGIIPFGINAAGDLQTSSQVDSGLQLVPETPDNSRSSLTTLEEALDQLRQQMKETPSSSDFSLHYIRGTDLDTSGRAARWVFGVKYDNHTVLKYFDSPGWRTATWEGAAPEKEIVEGSYVPPKSIIRRNAGVLYASDPKQEGQIRRIDLMNGKYTITMEQKGTQQIFVFDAVSGVPVA